MRLIAIVSLLAVTATVPAAQAAGTPPPAATALPNVSPSARASASPAASAATSPSPSPSASPSASLSEAEKKTLLSEFNRAQANEERAFRHTSKSELRELSASQAQKSRQWLEREREARRKFFDEHMSGPERRQYIQDYLQRKKAFDQSIKTEAESARKSWAEKAERLRAKQKEQRAQFKAQLYQGKRPDTSLWPN